jgi:hypothetical protein
MDNTLAAVNIGRVPSMEVEIALERGDGARIRQLGKSGIPQREFFDAVRAHTFNLSSQVRRGRVVMTSHYSSLLLWPVVVSNCTGDQVNAGLKAHPQPDPLGTASALRQWTETKSEVAILKGLLAYDFFAKQEAVDLRRLLNALVWREANLTATYGADRLHLPEGAPELVFQLAVATGHNVWPRLPEQNALSTRELATQMHEALRYVVHNTDSTGQESFAVGSPGVADTALFEGLRLWLACLWTTYKFGTWDVVPQGDDGIDLLIELKEADGFVARIPIRTYQIGIDAVEALVNNVSSMAEQFNMSDQLRN